MKKMIRMGMGLWLAAGMALAQQKLTLEDYLQQVQNQGTNYQAAKAQAEGYEKESHQMDLTYSPQLVAGYNHLVDDVLGVEDLRELFRDFARAAQEEAVGELHDVGLVDGVDFFAAMLAGVLEGKLGDARGAFFGDDLDGFNDAGNDFVLQADVLAFSVFADDDEIDAGQFGFESGKILDGAEVGEEVEFLAQGDVDAFESAADGGGDGAFECDLLRSMDS